MNRVILLLLTLTSSSFYCNEVILLNRAKSESLNSETLEFIDLEVYRALSSKLELNIIFSKDEGSADYIINLSMELDNDNYYLDVEIIKAVDGSILLKRELVHENLNRFIGEIDLFGFEVKDKLRFRPETNTKSQIVTNTSIPAADIYIDNVFAGKSPVIVRKELGSRVLIEARTESYKKQIEYEINSLELVELFIEMEPIVGSMLLRGDIAGRTLLLNGEEITIDKTALFKGLDIGTYDLSIESEWGFWEDSIVIKEDSIIEVDVLFCPIARVEISIGKNDKLLVFDSGSILVQEITSEGIYVYTPGEYRFETVRDGFIGVKEIKNLETGYLNRYVSPVLTPLISPEVIKREELASTQEFNRKLGVAKRGSLYTAFGSGGLLLLGILGEVIALNLYNSTYISSEAIEYRGLGEGLRVLNISLLSAGALGTASYFGIDLFKKEVPNG